MLSELIHIHDPITVTPCSTGMGFWKGNLFTVGAVHSSLSSSPAMTRHHRGVYAELNAVINLKDIKGYQWVTLMVPNDFTVISLRQRATTPLWEACVENVTIKIWYVSSWHFKGHVWHRVWTKLNPHWVHECVPTPRLKFAKELNRKRQTFRGDCSKLFFDLTIFYFVEE